MRNFNYQDIREVIKRARNIVVTSHHNPDGDAIGAVLGMYHFLLPFGKNLHAIVPNDYPGFLKWMEGNEDILLFDKNVKASKKAIEEADIIFCLDYNSLHRSGDMAEPIRNSKASLFLIDHHPKPALEEFTYFLSATEASSTAELVYHFISEYSPGHVLSKPLAESLFVGIMTDTGSFSYSCNKPETFQITADLINAGVNVERVHRLVYDTYSEDRLRLLGYSISDCMVVLPELKTAYIALSRQDLDRFNYQVGDTEGVVNYALSIDGIVVAVLMTERIDKIRLSFRSKGNFAVNQIASEHFKGGGHQNAAGGDSYVSLEATIEKLKNVLQQYKTEIDRSKF